jgi:hypothetical protein
VIATQDVRDGLGRRLSAAGWDISGPSGHKRHMVIDAADALSRVMRDGLPDPGVISEIASELDQYRQTASEGPERRLSIFGNVASALIADGNGTAAIALEGEWNRRTHGLPFLTLCGYSAACFHNAEPQLWSHTCHEHGAVSHTGDV